ncbi:MAG: nuclease-related domain-containing protein [bacterium]|nr:nuclease-related domain-containing protein [bacterium]MDD7616473.1 nuclease-related domain-containing protein [bacterium]MDY4158911.1 nuclease-related domain-containing protein [Candidatus Onthovivens sp.]
MIVFPLFIDFLNYKENPVGFTIFICALIFILLLLLFLIIFPFAKRHYNFKNFQKIYYKEIRKIAEINDYYLINNLVIKNNNQLICRIDHVLFGDKYIYVIKDRYYRGAISGKKEDSTWFFYSNQKKQFEMDNPMAMNEKRLEKLSLVTNIDKSFFISILVINDNCVVKNANELNKNNSFIVSKKNLRKLIKNIEKRNVKNMDQKQLEFAVQDISRLYGKNKQKNDTGDDIY